MKPQHGLREAACPAGLVPTCLSLLLSRLTLGCGSLCSPVAWHSTSRGPNLASGKERQIESPRLRGDCVSSLFSFGGWEPRLHLGKKLKVPGRWDPS